MKRLFTLLMAAMLTVVSSVALAKDDDPKTVEARNEFVRGNELAAATQWAQALAAFERSNELRPHPLTSFNMGVCERALGRFTRARGLFASTIAAAEKDPTALPASRVGEARGYVTTIEAELVRLDVVVEPTDVAISVDGRPLEVEKTEGSAVVATAGLAPPGEAQRAPSGSFVMVLDPGTHFIRFLATGYEPVTMTKTYAPGTKARLDAQLARLPATLRITSNVAGPIVTVDGADVGLAPVEISRPPGEHRVVVRKDGFVTFDRSLAVKPGQQVDLPATLPEERIPLTKRWWFWTAIGAAVVGGVLLTYAVTREPDPPPPYDGGTSNWVVSPR